MNEPNGNAVEYHLERSDPEREGSWYYQGTYRRLEGATLALLESRTDAIHDNSKHQFRLVERTISWKVLDL